MGAHFQPSTLATRQTVRQKGRYCIRYCNHWRILLSFTTFLPQPHCIRTPHTDAYCILSLLLARPCGPPDTAIAKCPTCDLGFGVHVNVRISSPCARWRFISSTVEWPLEERTPTSATAKFNTSVLSLYLYLCILYLLTESVVTALPRSQCETMRDVLQQNANTPYFAVKARFGELHSLPLYAHSTYSFSRCVQQPRPCRLGLLAAACPLLPVLVVLVVWDWQRTNQTAPCHAVGPAFVPPVHHHAAHCRTLLPPCPNQIGRPTVVRLDFKFTFLPTFQNTSTPTQNQPNQQTEIEGDSARLYG